MYGTDLLQGETGPLLARDGLGPQKVVAQGDKKTGGCGVSSDADIPSRALANL